MVSTKAVFYSVVYMICSVGILFANKLVLTTYRFPSFLFLALAQTVFSFLLAHFFLPSHVTDVDKPHFLFKVMPLSICYAVDILLGIAGTGSINLPMFSALRRLSNLFIMVGEKILLGVSRPFSVYMSVVVMVLGAGVAVVGDLAFDLLGYTYVFTNNFSTAAKALLTKSLLRDQGFSSLELLYYNSGLMIPALLVIVVFQTDFFQILHYPAWTEPLFLFCFMFSCCSAVLLNFSLIQCTHYTSALTTSILGVMKNILITYAGMFVGGDYIYSGVNFIGVTISAIGAVLYVVMMYRYEQSKKSAAAVSTETLPYNSNQPVNKT